VKQGVEEAVVVAVDVDMGVAVAVVGVDLTGRQPSKTHLATVEFPVFRVPLKSWIPGGTLKGVGAMVVHAVLSVVVAVVVSVMEKREMGNALVGLLNATVVLDEEMSSNVKELVEGTGELRLMKLLQ